MLVIELFDAPRLLDNAEIKGACCDYCLRKNLDYSAVPM